METEEDLLDCLLSVAAKELSELEENSKQSNNEGGSKLVESDLFLEEDKDPPKKIKQNIHGKSNNVLHSGDTDSSDDEERRNVENQKYNDCGREIKQLLSEKSSGESRECGFSSGHSSSSTSWKSKASNNKAQLTVPSKTPPKSSDVYTDPVFGLRIINPVISSMELQERMSNRMVLPFSRIKNFVQSKQFDGDFVIAGVIVNKSAVRTSQKGSQYSIWFLSDLKGDIKTITLFLFGSAHKQLWKTSTGMVIGILNPVILDKKDGSKDEGCFSIDNPQKAMVLGQSKDLGVCRSKKKNGEPCTAIVNKSVCEFCIYHIKQEYQKCSKRSELQSSFAGGGLTALRNKVLGKDQVFYAGKLYTSIPAKKNKKREKQDETRLLSLSGVSVNSNNIVKAKNQTVKKQSAAHLDVPLAQRKRDLELLKRLSSSSKGETAEKSNGSFIAPSSTDFDVADSKNVALSVISKLKEKKINHSVNDNTENIGESSSKSNLNGGDLKTPNNKKPLESKSPSVNDIIGTSPKTLFTKSADTFQVHTPVLGKSTSGIIDLSTPVTSTHIDRAKLNALKYIQKNGPIKKSDPNSIRSQNKKRPLENALKTDSEVKKQKIQENEFFSDRFKKMMEATSKHTDLLEQRDEEEQEKYFNKLEMREKMEEKMANTYKVACKAVKCLKCKYTSFSAADQCKLEKHPLRVFDAMKRFFKCGNCGNRTCSLDVVPMTACNNCGGGKWERTGMMKEKVVKVAHNLSIRGGEQQFVNSVISDANLNLLVPDG